MQRDDEGLQKHTLNLYPGDYEKLRDLVPDIGAAAVIRRLVRRAIEQIEATGVVTSEIKVNIDI